MMPFSSGQVRTVLAVLVRFLRRFSVLHFTVLQMHLFAVFFIVFVSVCLPCFIYASTFHHHIDNIFMFITRSSKGAF